MKLKTLSHLSIASAVSLACLSTPMVAQSATSADVSIANMYLWRGLDVSNATPQVSGTLKYSHASGFYAGGWTSSVWADNGGLGQEVDLFLGYGGEAGGVGYDISYWNYLYPEAGATVGVGLDTTNQEEVVLGLSYDMFSFGAYINVDSDTLDDNYYTLGFAMDKYSLTYGMWDVEDPLLSDEYSHLTFGFAATDELMFKLSVASSDDGSTEEDPLVQIVYSKSFDL